MLAVPGQVSALLWSQISVTGTGYANAAASSVLQVSVSSSKTEKYQKFFA